MFIISEAAASAVREAFAQDGEPSTAIELRRLSVPLLVSATMAGARPVQVLAATPAAEAIMHGGHAQYAVHFDGPFSAAK